MDQKYTVKHIEYCPKCKKVMEYRITDEIGGWLSVEYFCVDHPEQKREISTQDYIFNNKQSFGTFD